MDWGQLLSMAQMYLGGGDQPSANVGAAPSSSGLAAQRAGEMNNAAFANQSEGATMNLGGQGGAPAKRMTAPKSNWQRGSASAYGITFKPSYIRDDWSGSWSPNGSQQQQGGGGNGFDLSMLMKLFGNGGGA